MTADVVAACRTQIVLRRAFAAAERDTSPTSFGRQVAGQLVETLHAFTAILDLHEQRGDYCNTCGGLFPCRTVDVMAEALGVPVDGQQ